ncbi:hypothetical protein [Schlesneria paludicola]|uniref:hypothetical protein n=1 Tax=Schlesneria paludicola TaxID=360056 RepID=UPI00029AFAC3|nr:hypothetical protein [Schlesneria paludicola]
MQIIYESFMGPLPSSYVEVHRWASSEEVEQWKSAPTHIPLTLKGGERVFVTLPGAPKPGGTGPFRIEFAIPSAMLQPAGTPQWRQIFGPVANAPLLNLRIVRP